MRALWLGHNLAYPPKGGVLQRNYNLLREAAKKYEVHVLAFDQPGSRPAGVTPHDSVHSLKDFCSEVDWIPLSNGDRKTHKYLLAGRQCFSADPFDIHWLRSNRMMEKIKAICKRNSFDIVHVDTLGLAQYRPYLQNSATVLNHHNVESSMMSRRANNTGNILARHYLLRQASKLHKAEQRWCPEFKMNLVVSPEEEQLLRSAVPEIETAVVANGVDTDYFSPRPDPGGRTLLFCGGLSWYPNRRAIEFFFDQIWPRLTDWSAGVQMFVVGRKPPKWLEKLSSRDNRVWVTGFVDDVRPYFEKATAYVCPIKDGGGTRLKILDALAMGVPVIGTSFACTGLSLENGKHVLLAETPEEFVYQIERAFSSHLLRECIAANGREVVERKYAWNVIGRSLIRAYERASHGPSPSICED